MSHSPAAAPLYYAPPSGYGPYQPPVSPAHGNKRLFLIFGALAAVIVVAQGAHFDFYINGAHVGQTDDETIRDGQTALVVSGDSEAVFTNLTISQIN